MLFNPKPLGKGNLPAEVIKEDLAGAVKYGQCAISGKALYLGSSLRANSSYIPIPDVERVFKRLAVTKGFYEQDRAYASIAYFVAVYDGGKEKQCKFENEEELGLFLNAISKRTDIPIGKA